MQELGSFIWSVDDVLDRHENPEHRARIYPYGWNEKKWMLEEEKNRRSRTRLQESERQKEQFINNIRLQTIRTVAQLISTLSKEQELLIKSGYQNLATVIHLVIKRKLTFEERREREKRHLKTIGVVRNGKSGIRELAKQQLQPGRMDELSDDSIVCALLCFLMNPRDTTKANRKMREYIVPLYTQELIDRGINPSKENLQRYMQELPEERRKKLFKQ